MRSRVQNVYILIYLVVYNCNIRRRLYSLFDQLSSIKIE